MNPSGLRLTTFAAPLRFYALTGALLPWLWGGAALLGLVGLYLAFAVAPTDAVQGEAYRILYLHVPAAWLSMLLYLAMAFWAALGWVLRVRMAAVLARAIAPTGALFTALSLVSGSLWGQPTWGTWWVWDARLTSSLILLFLYLGYLLLIAAIEDTQRADAAGALLALVGAVNVPIIYFSVRWWNTLHQGASLSPSGGSRLAPSMLAALLVCTLACWIYAFAVIFLRARALVLEREAHTDWVKELKR
ncbi:heme ABC transporter permease CcmC [Pseudorhodoferax sp.]|jgi:heme exporter protein C|uniref:heme ABC transporter permease CcmC n=1 Tax=Pseudorhodoferax sp. TaxID=1993553 RepID=UPI001B4E27DE|nr:heme ABC transporter permease CcmC [Pseudorhodoferax sp.]MBP8145109.1 cytochrome c biogenesis protein CcsA [Inhella sp.]